MKFIIKHCNSTKDEQEKEIKTLEELKEFAMSVNEKLIIKFRGVTSNAWFPYGEKNDKISQMQYIIIYDDYME